MLRTELTEFLHRGLSTMGQSLDKHTELKLIRYIEMVAQWNKAYRLSSLHDLDAMVTRHLLESLSLLPYLKGKTILDVGTGAGLPGIPLSIALPHHQFCLLDNNHKKIQFLLRTCQLLYLRNVQVANRAAKEFEAKSLFESIVSRAFSTLGDFVLQSQHLMKPGAQILAMKGVYPLTELQDIPPDFKVIHVHPVTIPNLAAERHIVELRYEPEE